MLIIMLYSFQELFEEKSLNGKNNHSRKIFVGRKSHA